MPDSEEKAADFYLFFIKIEFIKLRISNGRAYAVIHQRPSSSFKMQNIWLFSGWLFWSAHQIKEVRGAKESRGEEDESAGSASKLKVPLFSRHETRRNPLCVCGVQTLARPSSELLSKTHSVCLSSREDNFV